MSAAANEGRLSLPVYDHCPTWCRETEHPEGTDVFGKRTPGRRRGSDDRGLPHWRHIGGKGLPVSVNLERDNVHGEDRAGFDYCRPDFVSVSVERRALVDDGDPMLDPHLRITPAEARSFAAMLLRAAETLELS